MRGAWLLQSEARHESTGCTYGLGPPGVNAMLCKSENTEALLLLIILCTAITSIMCAFAFFREDKEEQITPLCPQLLVAEPELRFHLPLGGQADSMVVTDDNGRTRCKVVIDWPDPFRPGTSGVAATVRLQNEMGDLLATVVARNVAMQGQGLALCRSGCEIFGFVEPEMQPNRRYHVRHRTGVHLLTLIGDFASMDIEGINPVGSKVCSLTKLGFECSGKIIQHIDAGLVLCSILATYVHRRLSVTVASPTAGLGPAALQEEDAAQLDEDNNSGSRDAVAGDGEDLAIHSSGSSAANEAGAAAPQAAAAGSTPSEPENATPSSLKDGASPDA